MSNQTTESTREMLLALIEAEYESDAAFERALGLAEKTVNNWRRGRSASFMKMLPLLSERFGIQVGALMDIPLKGEAAELSEEELHLLHLYRNCINKSSYFFIFYYKNIFHRNSYIVYCCSSC